MTVIEALFGVLALFAIYAVSAAIERAATKISDAVREARPPVDKEDRDLIHAVREVRNVLHRIDRGIRGEPEPPGIGDLLGAALRGTGAGDEAEDEDNSEARR